MKTTVFSLIAIASIMSAPTLARDQIHIVSTPSDFNFTTTVGENFARSYHQPVPLVEKRSAGTAVKYFCAGVGRQHPDVVGLARPLQVHELERCQENGVKRITEIKFGYDGVVVASGGAQEPFPLTRRQLFQALAAKLPVDGKIVRNPYRKWNEIDPQLPDMPIKVVSPLLDSDMGQATMQLIMEPGCRSFPEIEALGEKKAARLCSSLRSDGAFEQISRNYEDALREVASSRRVTAILPYTVFVENEHRVAAHPIEGVMPDEVSIAMNRAIRSPARFIFTSSWPTTTGCRASWSSLPNTPATGPGDRTATWSTPA